MEHERIYGEILRQGLDLCPVPPNTGTVGFTAAAETLADDLYRLCIEFGVAYNDFKATVLDEVLARRSVSSPQSPRTSFLDAFEGRLRLVIFALELMREDQDFLV